MYLKYLIGGHNARKKFFLIKYVDMNMFHLILSPTPTVVKNR